jgi:hypothetical protein
MGGFDAILGIFDERQVRQMADTFKGEWEAKCFEKRRWCMDRGLDEQLDKDHKEVLRLLGMCGNAYLIDALREFVFVEEVVPQWKHIEEVANAKLTKVLT